MHELSIMQSASDRAEDKARAAGATKIHRIRLRVGALSGVVADEGVQIPPNKVSHTADNRRM